MHTNSVIVSDKHLDRGIWKTAYGYRVMIRIRGKLHMKRFPPIYTLERLQKWRDDHEQRHRPKTSERGTFADDAARYLYSVRTMSSYSDRQRDIQRWVDVFGDRPRWELTPELIRAQLSTWKAEGGGFDITTGKPIPLANNTVNHRRTALSHLFTVLDGKSGYNPVKDVPPFALPPPLKRGLPMATVLRVLRRVRGPKTKARLEVLAWTGLRPSELMRLTPELVNTKRGVALVPTAKGGPPREIAFNLAGPAWKRLLKADALGEFSVQSMRKSLVRACKAAKVPPFRVYDLRHSFLSALRKSGADLSDVQAQAGHSDIALTRRYAPTITTKLRAAVARLRGRKLPHRVASKRK